MRTFDGGATRDDEDGKLDFEGFLSPFALRAFAEYMHKHRATAKGARSSDNWQKGIPLDAYLRSAFRHFFRWWELSRSERVESTDEAIETLCALFFNVQGALHEIVKRQGSDDRAVRGMPERGEQGFGDERLTEIPSGIYWDEPGQGGT